MNPFYILVALTVAAIVGIFARTPGKKTWGNFFANVSLAAYMGYITFFFYLLNQYLQHNFQFVGQVLQYIVSHQGMPS